MQEIVSEQDPAVEQDLPERAGFHVPACRNNHRLPNDPQPPAEAQPVGQDQVLQNRDLRESPQRQETVPADEEAVGSHHPAHPGQEQMIQPPFVRPEEQARRFVPLEEAAADRPFSDDVADPPDRIGREHHVGMGEQQDFSCRCTGAGIHLLRPAVPRPQERHAGARPGYPVGPILRAAVYHQQLIRAETDQVRENSANEVALVENRKNDRDRRHRQTSQAATIATDPYSAKRTQSYACGMPWYMK